MSSRRENVHGRARLWEAGRRQENAKMKSNWIPDMSNEISVTVLGPIFLTNRWGNSSLN